MQNCAGCVQLCLRGCLKIIFALYEISLVFLALIEWRLGIRLIRYTHHHIRNLCSIYERDRTMRANARLSSVAVEPRSLFDFCPWKQSREQNGTYVEPNRQVLVYIPHQPTQASIA